MIDVQSWSARLVDVLQTKARLTALGVAALPILGATPGWYSGMLHLLP